MVWTPRPAPETSDVGELRQWLNEEFRNLSLSLTETDAVDLRASRHAPDKPREGMIIHADGTAWNPGSGQGTYRYQSGVWVPIGTPFNVSQIPNGSLTNTMLANMTAPAVKARGTAGTGAPEDIAIGNGITLDATSLRTAQQMSVTVDSSGLKLSGDATSPGNSKYYGTDGSGTKGFNSLPASGGVDYLSSGAVGTGTTYTVTGLGGYKALWCRYRNVSHNSGLSQTPKIALSGDNGSTFGTAFNINGGTSYAGSLLLIGDAIITRCDQTNNQIVTVTANLYGPSPAQEDTSARGPINALQFSFSAGSFDNGNIDIYGFK